MTQVNFLFTAVQPGFEPALKHEIARRHPDLKFAFSRPGFVTFRIADDAVAAPLDMKLRAAFARTWGVSLGKVKGAEPATLARDVWRTVGARLGPDRLAEFRHVHCWRRGDVPGADLPGDERFDAAGAAAAQQAGELIVQQRLVDEPAVTLALNAHAERGDLVLDCVLVEPNEWWLGWHRAESPETRWPGGVPHIEPKKEMISRAYLKLVEALQWAELRPRSGDRCVEIGSAPGGSCLYLLERGCRVIGVDPAEMDPTVLAHKGFTHVRARAKDADRGVFRGCRWLTADINLPPNYTLDTVEAILADPEVSIDGLVLTLKLAEPNLAAQLPLFNKRIRSWGYDYVRARQLAFDRQEVCVVASRP